MSDIIFKEKKNIAILTLSREKTLNAWTSKMRKQICKVFAELKKKKHIKAIIITGSGKKAPRQISPSRSQTSQGYILGG